MSLGLSGQYLHDVDRVRYDIGGSLLAIRSNRNLQALRRWSQIVAIDVLALGLRDGFSNSLFQTVAIWNVAIGIDGVRVYATQAPDDDLSVPIRLYGGVNAALFYARFGQRCAPCFALSIDGAGASREAGVNLGHLQADAVPSGGFAGMGRPARSSGAALMSEACPGEISRRTGRLFWSTTA